MEGKRTISTKRLIEALKEIKTYCEEQGFCQNCVLHEDACDHWECKIDVLDLEEVISRFENKKKNGGYLS